MLLQDCLLYSLEGIFIIRHTMTWIVEYTEEFECWWQELDESEQEDVAAYVGR